MSEPKGKEEFERTIRHLPNDLREEIIKFRLAIRTARRKRGTGEITVNQYHTFLNLCLDLTRGDIFALTGDIPLK